MINFFKQLFSTNPDAKEEENFNLTYLDSRLEEINNKLDDTEYRIDDLESKDFDSIEYRIENLEDRYQTVTDGLYVLQGSLNRIANALEEVLRLVKQDQEESKKK